ncbi:hypothetical protein F53441_10603 [Fusarium austroafricanum]|uniref:Uncharacterized protein n=1 Tax=Fusarium austroafricanum TaxID=2364996 RepID=A0A8H4P233_9HYPO|nr:hypothetical protein F53441_10603 [Fusarium austroafricanum]
MVGMTITFTHKADASVPKKSIPEDATTQTADTNPTTNKADHPTAEGSSNKNIDGKKVKSDKGDNAAKQEDRDKVWEEHYQKLFNQTDEEFYAEFPELKNAPVAATCPSKAFEYINDYDDDNLEDLEQCGGKK